MKTGCVQRVGRGRCARGGNPQGKRSTLCGAEVQKDSEAYKPFPIAKPMTKTDYQMSCIRSAVKLVSGLRLSLEEKINVVLKVAEWFEGLCLSKL